MLLAKEADVNLQTNNGYTALMLAAQNGLGQIVQLLLAKDANVNLQNKYGDTALTFAVQGKKQDIVQMLSKAANVKRKLEEVSVSSFAKRRK